MHRGLSTLLLDRCERHGDLALAGRGQNRDFDKRNAERPCGHGVPCLMVGNPHAVQRGIHIPGIERHRLDDTQNRRGRRLTGPDDGTCVIITSIQGVPGIFFTGEHNGNENRRLRYASTMLSG